MSSDSSDDPKRQRTLPVDDTTRLTEEQIRKLSSLFLFLFLRPILDPVHSDEVFAALKTLPVLRDIVRHIDQSPDPVRPFSLLNFPLDGRINTSIGSA